MSLEYQKASNEADSGLDAARSNHDSGLELVRTFQRAHDAPKVGYGRAKIEHCSFWELRGDVYFIKILFL